MNSKPNKVAVLTGDLVNSTQLTKDQMTAAFETLSKCSSEAAEWHGASLQFSRHRGDGWQVILKQPKYALRTALFFRASLKALGSQFDTYIGISAGDAELEEGTDLNNRNEEVFILSGRALDTAKSKSDYYLKLVNNTTSHDAATTALAAYIVEDWTPAQAQVMSHMLTPNINLSFTDLAKTLGKSRQVVTKTLAAAGFASLDIALYYLEKDDD